MITIQQMSRITGVSIDTLRYYERIGLIDPVKRATSGHRRYTDADVKRVNFLKRLRATGMPIKEMQRYVDLFRAGDETVTERRLMLEEHRQEIAAQMHALQETLDLLDDKIMNYRLQEKELV